MNDSVIRITRGDDSFGIARKLKVFIDDVEVGNAGWNETSDFQTAAGPHEVYVKMDWCRSAPFAFDSLDGDAVELEVTIPSGTLTQFFAMAFKSSRFFGLRTR